MPPPSPFAGSMPPPSPSPRHRRSAGCHPGPATSLLMCKQSPSATIDLLILLLVLFSSLFLLASFLSHLLHSLSLLLPPPSSLPPLPLALSFAVFFLLAAFFALRLAASRSRRCGRHRCRAMKRSMEFGIQLQTEDCLRSAGPAAAEIDHLPWKGGAEGNPDYECLRSELRRMAPPNGRAVLLFKARCGCPVAKLEAWGPKRARRHKRGAPLAIEGGR